MYTLREMVNIIVSTKVSNKWVMLITLIIFDVNKSHVKILSDLSRDSSCVNLNVGDVL